MKLVTINNALLLKYNGDSEILQKSTRPYVLVIRLKYKGLNYDFAVPIRSNIPASAPKTSILHYHLVHRRDLKTVTVCTT